MQAPVQCSARQIQWAVLPRLWAEAFKYYRFTDAQSPEEFEVYIDKCKELSLYDTGVSAEYGDKLITLSTFEYSRTNGRLVVVAKKVTESSGANAPANDGAAAVSYTHLRNGAFGNDLRAVVR